MISPGDPNFNNIEVLILAFVKVGLSSPYDFVSNLDMGVASSAPILRRLESEGLLQSTPGPRKRTSFALTAMGEAQLEKFVLNPDIMKYYRLMRFREVRRSLFLEWLLGGSNAPQNYLNDLQGRLSVKAESAQADAKSQLAALKRFREPSPESFQPEEVMIAVYKWLGSEINASELRHYSEILNELEQAISRLPIPPSLIPIKVRK